MQVLPLLVGDVGERSHESDWEGSAFAHVEYERGAYRSLKMRSYDFLIAGVTVRVYVFNEEWDWRGPHAPGQRHAADYLERYPGMRVCLDTYVSSIIGEYVIGPMARIAADAVRLLKPASTAGRKYYREQDIRRIAESFRTHCDWCGDAYDETDRRKWLLDRGVWCSTTCRLRGKSDLRRLDDIDRKRDANARKVVRTYRERKADEAKARKADGHGDRHDANVPR